MAFLFELTPLFMIACLGVGLVSGLLAGLLGIGGGIVLVPALLYLLPQTEIVADGHDAHYAIATALSIIVPTGLSSAMAHIKKGAFDRGFFIKLAPGIALGSIFGPVLATSLSSETLTLIFAGAIVVLALLMLRKGKVVKGVSLDVPPAIDAVAGAMNGMISALIGIGGATLNVPYMSMRGLDVHKAIGTASALGIVIAVIGSCSFMVNGMMNDFGLPASDWTLGFVLWPATVFIAMTSIATAPIGARLSHALPTTHMRRIFSAFMIIVAIKMSVTIITG